MLSTIADYIVTWNKLYMYNNKYNFRMRILLILWIYKAQLTRWNI